MSGGVERIEAVIREGLSKLGAGKPLRIRISPKDMEFIEIVGLPVEISKEELGVLTLQMNLYNLAVL